MHFFKALLTAASTATIVLAAPAHINARIAPIVFPTDTVIGTAPATTDAPIPTGTGAPVGTGTGVPITSTELPHFSIPVPFPPGVFPPGHTPVWVTEHTRPTATGTGISSPTATGGFVSIMPVGPIPAPSGTGIQFQPGGPIETSTAF